MLDSILQIAGKNWCTGETLRELFDTLEDASQQHFGTNLQAVYCRCGVDYTVNWKAKTSVKKAA